jgi:hypothetical protein
MSFQDKRITELDELTSPASGDYLPIVDVSDTAAGTTKKISFSTIGTNAVVSASNITSGTLADARLSANVTVQGNVFNAANKLVQLDGSTKLPAVDGSQLTALTATNISSGTLADARLSANVTVQGNSFNAASKLVQLDGSSRYPALDGSQITNLSKTQVGLSSVPNVDCTDASNITSGTLADARLSTNVSLKIKTVTPIGAAGPYPLTSAFNDTWYVTSHAAGIVAFVLDNGLIPGTEIKIFTNSAQTVSYTADSSITVMYPGGSIAPGGTYTPVAAAGKTISVHCVSVGLVFITGL